MTVAQAEAERLTRELAVRSNDVAAACADRERHARAATAAAEARNVAVGKLAATVAKAAKDAEAAAAALAVESSARQAEDTKAREEARAHAAALDKRAAEHAADVAELRRRHERQTAERDQEAGELRKQLQAREPMSLRAVLTMLPLRHWVAGSCPIVHLDLHSEQKQAVQEGQSVCARICGNSQPQVVGGAVAGRRKTAARYPGRAGRGPRDGRAQRKHSRRAVTRGCGLAGRRCSRQRGGCSKDVGPAATRESAGRRAARR